MSTSPYRGGPFTDCPCAAALLIASITASSPIYSPAERTARTPVLISSGECAASSSLVRASMSTSHSPALIKYIVSPTSPLLKMNSPGANCKVLNLGRSNAASGSWRTAASTSASVTSICTRRFARDGGNGFSPFDVIQGCAMISAIVARLFGSISRNRADEVLKLHREAWLRWKPQTLPLSHRNYLKDCLANKWKMCSGHVE